MAITKKIFIDWLNNPSKPYAWVKYTNLKLALETVLNCIPDNYDLGTDQNDPEALLARIFGYFCSKPGNDRNQFILTEILRALNIQEKDRAAVRAAVQARADWQVFVRARGEIGFFRHLDIDLTECGDLKPEKIPHELFHALGIEDKTIDRPVLNEFLEKGNNKNLYGKHFAVYRIAEVKEHVRLENDAKADGKDLVAAIEKQCAIPAALQKWHEKVLDKKYDRGSVTYEIYNGWRAAKPKGKNAATFMNEFLGVTAAEEKKAVVVLPVEHKQNSYRPASHPVERKSGGSTEDIGMGLGLNSSLASERKSIVSHESDDELSLSHSEAKRSKHSSHRSREDSKSVVSHSRERKSETKLSPAEQKRKYLKFEKDIIFKAKETFFYASDEKNFQTAFAEFFNANSSATQTADKKIKYNNRWVSEAHQEYLDEMLAIHLQRKEYDDSLVCKSTKKRRR